MTSLEATSFCNEALCIFVGTWLAWRWSRGPAGRHLICWTTFILGYVHGYNWERHSQPGDRYPGSHWEMDAWPSRDWVDRPGRIIPVQSRVITPQDWQWYLSICLWDKPGTGRHGTGDYTDTIFIYFLFSLEVKQHGRHWNSGSIRRLPGVWFVEPYGHARSLSSELFLGGSWFLFNFLPVSCYSTSGWISWCLLATPRLQHRRRTPTIYYDDMESRNWATYTVNGHDFIGL